MTESSRVRAVQGNRLIQEPTVRENPDPGMGPPPMKTPHPKAIVMAMSTHQPPAATADADRSGRRAMGSVLAATCLLAGPALIGLGLALYTSPWSGTVPDLAAIDAHHGQMLLSLNLSLLAFPFLYGSVVAIAVAARRSPWLASSGLACSLLGLTAMLVNGLVDLPLIMMAGIDERAGFAELATALDTRLPIVSYLFPLYLIGTVLLAGALWRAKEGPRWSALCIGVGGLFPLAAITGIGPTALIIASIRIAGSIPIVKALLTRPAGA
ncbi:hypothetical protein [Nonomuraea dietziae]|uniref:hypothetical protein n=1 Tax=Nonomuraea dietziae TaxID=65515 RepID=UPI00343FB379